MNYLIAMAQSPGAGGGSPLANPIFMMLLFVGIFYFLLIRPQQKQQKQRQKMLTELKKGDKIITTGGIHGVIVNIKDNTLLVKVAENIKLDISRSNIAVVKTEQEQTKS